MTGAAVLAAWRAELGKIATVRGLWLGAVFASLAVPVVSLLVVATGGLGAGDTATSGAATGALVGLLGFGAWGATVATSEYSQGTMVVSLAVVPDRRVLYGSKLLAVGAVAGAGALAAAVVSLLTVLAVTPDDPVADHGVGNPLALAALVLASVAVAVAGAAVGTLTRSPQASTAIVVAALLLPKAAADLLGGLERWVVGSSPGTVVTQVVEGAQLASSQQFPGGAAVAALAMVAVAAAVATAGAVDFARRDA